MVALQLRSSVLRSSNVQVYCITETLLRWLIRIPDQVPVTSKFTVLLKRSAALVSGCYRYSSSNVQVYCITETKIVVVHQILRTLFQ